MNQKRGGFHLDANTMGLATSKPPIATARGTQQDKRDKEKKKEQEQQQQEQQQSSSERAATDAPTGYTQCNPNMEPLPTEHFSSKVQKLGDICGDGARLNFEMNDIFLKRLESIDQQCAGDSAELLRLVTLQDWVDQLLHVNYVLFGDMTAMEMEAYKKIMVCFQSSRGEQQQALDENRKLRKDLCAILKLVQEAYHHNNWNTKDMCLETLTVNQVLGLKDCQCPESASEKVTKGMQSLVDEVAAKYDEVCHLRCQLMTMDEVVQTARQKIILKDKCIAQLNQQLVELQDCVTKMTKDSSKDTLRQEHTTDSDVDLGNLDASSCFFEGLNERDQQENELLRLLDIELSEFIDLVNKQDFSAIQRRRKLLSSFFERINLEHSKTLKNLENLRSQLRSLDGDLDQQTEPMAASTKIQVLENEGDSQLVESIRRRLRSLNECNKDLNDKYQQVEGQYRVQLLEMQYNYEAERSINQKNCRALKEIADLISKLRCSDLSYEEIYSEASAKNPFCVVIMEMYDKLNELENCTEREELRLNNERLIFQVQNLRSALEDREGKIQELRTVVNGYADISETNRLKDEISALKQRNTEQAQKVCEIARLLKKQEEERQKLCRNYENLMNTSDDQCKELRRANREVQGLQDRLSQVEKTQEELRTERNLLREEIVALKEKEARSTGRERALNDQLKCRQQELEKSRILLRDMHNHLKQEERQHKDTVARLCQANEEVRLQLQAVSCECKEMQLKLKQQTSVTEQQQLIIESFRKWKDAQLRSDEVMRQCIKRAEEHINALLDENQHLTEEYRRLYGDYCVLEIEMRRIKNAVNIRLPSGSAEQPEVVLRGQKVHEEMINRMRYMRMTSQRLSDQVKVLNASPRDLHTPTTYRSTPTTISEQQQHQQQLEQQQQQQQQQQQSQQQQQQQQLTLSKNAWQLHRPN